MTEQNNAPSQEEIDFRARHKAAWEEVHQFHETAESEQDFFGKNNPQHRLAAEFFQMYLEKKPSEIATKALRNAFTMWGNLKGVSDQVQAALKHISYEEDVWDEVNHGLLRSFYEHDSRQEEAILLLEELVQKVVPLKSRSALLCTLADTWESEGETEKARRGFEQIIEWDASEWHVDHARGHIYEFDNLTIGQPAPRFSLPDIDSNRVDLADYQGKVVVLHFWGTGCGWCQFIYPHLREIAQEYSEDKVVLIGLSEDRDFDALRARITEEKFTWPQVCEGNGWKDTVFNLYNVDGIPGEYIIDQAGKIAFKLSGAGEGSGEELEEAVRSLVT